MNIKNLTRALTEKYPFEVLETEKDEGHEPTKDVASVLIMAVLLAGILAASFI